MTVAKAAPHDAPLQPVDYTGAAGPRYDGDGNIIPHSILGTIEDYKTVALQTGDVPVVSTVVTNACFCVGCSE